MKLYTYFFIAILFSINLYAQSFTINLENDVVDGDDNHYTNGTSFMYLSNKDTNDLEKYDSKFFKYITSIPTFTQDTKYQSFGIAYSQLAFTPDDLKRSDKIVGDVPYAGVITLDFALFKWNENLFHQYMLTIGMVGPSTRTAEFQKGYHDITGNTKPEGWDNQLKDNFLYNFAYSFGYKNFKKSFSYGKMDIISSVRIDLGNYNRAAMVGTMLRYGNNYPDTFNTVGRLIGSNENNLLNIDSKTNKDFGWALSYGLGYTYTDYFYINDYDKSYELDKIEGTLTQLISIDTFYDDFLLSFNFKTSKLIFTNENSTRENWGGVSLTYIF